MRRRTLLRRGMVAAALAMAGCTDDPGSSAPDADGSPGASPVYERTRDPDGTDGPSSSPPPAGTDSPGGGQTPRPADSPSSGTPVSTPSSGTPASTPAADQTVVVAPGGSLSFDPASFAIAAGETVRWTWEAGGHNVKPGATPDGSDWTGTTGDEFETFDGGYAYAATFDVPGTYEYYCAPHRGSGMVGSFEVG